MSLTRWKIFAGISLLVLSTAATALSLGRVRGTALIGRALDLSVQAMQEPQLAIPEASCFAVELFYGDSRVSPSTVNLVPERSAAGELRLRVRSSAAVDEPVVTLFIRNSCGATVSRRYVLLAEALTDAAEPSAGFTQPINIAPPRSSSSAGQAANPSEQAGEPRQAFGGVQSADTPANQARQTRAERASQRRAARLAAQGAAVEAPASLKVAKSTPPASVVRKAKPEAPRLKLDLIDLSSTPLSLLGSSELVSVPTGDEAVRRQAQALWRMLNASPEEAMQEVQRLDKLEAQTRASQEQSKRQAAEIASLAAQLEQAKKERYVNPLTIVLGLLTLAAVAFAIRFWRRGSSVGKPWWGSGAGKVVPQDEQHLWGHLADSAMADLPGDAQKKGSLVTEASPTSYFSALNSNQNALPVGVNQSSNTLPRTATATASLGSKSVSNPDVLRSTGNSHPTAEKVYPVGQRTAINKVKSTGRLSANKSSGVLVPSSKSAAQESKSGFGQSDFAPSVDSVPRVVAAEELFDIQEQADFFLSLNQPEQAIEVLKNHITENVETSALAYMDLFNIYHNTGMQTDYAELRDEFNRVFNADVPEFSQYGTHSNGLEDFPQVLVQIQQAWHLPHQAQDVIEESIFRQPEQDQQPLDMTAYRELMLLYALAKELGRPDSGYSKLPLSAQIPSQSNFGNSADIELGDGLILSSPDIQTSAEKDQTINLAHPLTGPQVGVSQVNEGLDFDLSDSGELSSFKLPGATKKT
jgi:pilus assembly protein FimV